MEPSATPWVHSINLPNFAWPSATPWVLKIYSPNCAHGALYHTMGAQHELAQLCTALCHTMGTQSGLEHAYGGQACTLLAQLHRTRPARAVHTPGACRWWPGMHAAGSAASYTSSSCCAHPWGMGILLQCPARTCGSCWGTAALLPAAVTCYVFSIHERRTLTCCQLQAVLSRAGCSFRCTRRGDLRQAQGWNS